MCAGSVHICVIPYISAIVWDNDTNIRNHTKVDDEENWNTSHLVTLSLFVQHKYNKIHVNGMGCSVIHHIQYFIMLKYIPRIMHVHCLCFVVLCFVFGQFHLYPLRSYFTDNYNKRRQNKFVDIFCWVYCISIHHWWPIMFYHMSFSLHFG